jgi:hypothetical protein
LGFFKHLPVSEDVSSRKDFFGKVASKLMKKMRMKKKICKVISNRKTTAVLEGNVAAAKNTRKFVR